MSASATLRATIVAALSNRPCTTFALAELAGMEWDENTRKRVHEAIICLRADGFRIVNLHLQGSHRGGMYVMTRVKPCPLLFQVGPDYTPYLRVPLPPIRCGTPGCVAYLARDHILQGGVYCSPCWEERVEAGCRAILAELGQREVTVETASVPNQAA